MRLIDVDDAIKEIKHDLESLWYASDIKRYEEGVEFAINRLEDMETIEIEPVKHGKWIHDGKRIKGGVDWWHCSECLATESGVYVEKPYCPNCGARMDK